MKKWVQNKSSDTWQALLFVLGRPSDIIRGKPEIGEGCPQRLLSLPAVYAMSVQELALWASFGARSRMTPEYAEHALCVFLQARHQLKKSQPKQEKLSHAR